MSAFKYDKDSDGIVTVTMDMSGSANVMNDEYAEAMRSTVERLEAEQVNSGKLKYRESIAEGLENAVEAFKGMLKGKNFGKQLVHIAD